MPLPEQGGTWPPENMARVYDRMAVWSAWYSGDAEELTDVYTGGQPAGSGQKSEFSFEDRKSGAGVASARDRYFWGQPPTPGVERNRLHVPIPADISTLSADTLFADPPAFRCEDPSTQLELDALREQGAMDTMLNGAAEMASALTGVYLRVAWDTSVRDCPFLCEVSPDAAVPEFRYGVLTAVTFWYVVMRDGRKVWRHLERHEPGVIYHGLYEGDATKLGAAVPLKALPATAGMEPKVQTAKDTMTAVYVPNMTPSRLWRRDPGLAPLGRSDYSGVEPLFDRLDETATSWMRDVRLGKARLMVPSSYLESAGPGKGATFDADREYFTTFEMLDPGGGTMQISLAQFAIRVKEHEATALHWVKQIVRAAGYSAQSLGESTEVATTATEVHARERRTLVTRAKKVQHWRRGLAAALEALLRVDAEVFKAKISPERPRVEFPAAVKEQPLILAQTVETLDRARAISTHTKIRMAHPEWTAPEVDAEVTRLLGEAAVARLAEEAA